MLPGPDLVLPPERLTSQRLIHTKIVRIDGGELTMPVGSLVVRAPVYVLQLDAAGVVLPPPRTRGRVYGVLHAVNHQRAQEGPSPLSVLEASLQVPEHLDPRFRFLRTSSRAALPTTSPECGSSMNTFGRAIHTRSTWARAKAVIRSRIFFSRRKGVGANTSRARLPSFCDFREFPHANLRTEPGLPPRSSSDTRSSTPWKGTIS